MQDFQVSTLSTSIQIVPTNPIEGSIYLEAVKRRPTVYGVTNKIPVSDDRIIDIVTETTQTLPSSWNMQSTRILVTLGKEHKNLWDAVMAAAKPFVLKQHGDEDWKRNEDCVQSFEAVCGTVRLFPSV